MSDDKPSRRHLDFTRTVPSIEESGEHDSGDSWHEDKTPPARPIPTVIVDPKAMKAEVERDYPAAFAELLTRTVAAEDRADAAHRLATKAEARWKWPLRVAAAMATGSLGLATYVLTSVRSSGYEARVTEQYREAVVVHTAEFRIVHDKIDDKIDDVRDQIDQVSDAVSELRGRLGFRPIRSVPVPGPHDKDD